MATVQEHQQVLLELLKEFDRICKKHNIKYSLFAGSALGAVRHNGFIPWDDDLDVVLLRKDYNKFLQVAVKEIQRDKYYLQAEFSEHWPMHFSKLRKNNTTCLEKYYPKDDLIHQGIYIDIFPCDNASDNAIIRRLQYLCSRIVIAKTLSERGYVTDNKLKKAFIKICDLLPYKFFYSVAINAGKETSNTVHTFFGGTSKYKKGIYPRKWFINLKNEMFECIEVPISTHYDLLLNTLYGDYMTIPPEEDRKCKKHAILVDVNKSYTEYSKYRDGMEFDIFTRSIR